MFVLMKERIKSIERVRRKSIVTEDSESYDANQSQHSQTQALLSAVLRHYVATMLSAEIYPFRALSIIESSRQPMESNQRMCYASLKFKLIEKPLLDSGTAVII